MYEPSKYVVRAYINGIIYRKSTFVVSAYSISEAEECLLEVYPSAKEIERIYIVDEEIGL